MSFEMMTEEERADEIAAVTEAADTDIDAVRTIVRDALADELLSAFGISVQDDQEYIADVFMRRLWPLIVAFEQA
jgi:hypothetical protein